MNSDAQILLEDVFPILEEMGLDQRKLAMLKSCEAVDLTEDALVLATRAGFVKKTLESSADLIEQALSQAAFAPLKLCLELRRDAQPAAVLQAPAPVSAPAQAAARPMAALFAQGAQAGERPARERSAGNTMSVEEFERLAHRTVARPAAPTPLDPEEAERAAAEQLRARRQKNPLVGKQSATDSELTFATFVEGEENRIACQAAKQVADGAGGFNPLFIYGRSGLGKTHLLKAIQNYIVTNDPTRLCAYKTAREFLNDYVQAIKATREQASSNAAGTLERNYQDIDVLIIDDIQQLANAQGTIDFFFNIFNYLHDHGKQIIIAADRTPQELGAQLGFDERVTSRVGGGFQVGIEVPAFELKCSLIESFLTRLRQDAAEGGRPEAQAQIDDELIQFMAEKAGSNIRTIKAFCLSVLYKASDRQSKGQQLSRADITLIAKERFPTNQRIISIEDVQEYVEAEYGVSHTDLIGSKRVKELMEPRHVAIWLSRALTENTLADIGEHFGGRSHGTVKHSIKWVEDMQSENRLFANRLVRMREGILEQ